VTQVKQRSPRDAIRAPSERCVRARKNTKKIS
jgi:hypothetical protein